jgi:hypothetical protein
MRRIGSFSPKAEGNQVSDLKSGGYRIRALPKVQELVEVIAPDVLILDV